MEAPSYPDYVDESLKRVRVTMHLRWNPRAFVIRAGSFDPYGQPVAPKYEGRYEVWDTDAEGAEYKIMQVQDDKGEFMLPSQWLLDTLDMFNPERYGGDITRMMKLLEERGDRLRGIEEKDFNNLLDAVASSWIDYARLSVPSAGVPN